MKLIRGIYDNELVESLVSALVVKVSLAYVKVSAVIYHFLSVLF
jgi:hypothetical protein